MKKRIIFVVLLAMTLSACGTEQKVEVEKEEVTIETPIEETDTTPQDTLAENEDVQESPMETPTEQGASSSSQEQVEQKPSSSSQGQTEQKPSSSSQTQVEQKPSSSSPAQTTQKPTTEKTEQKKLVDSYSEEVTGPEKPFKYGVTTYEWTNNYVGVYSDGSKKILSSNTETRYNHDNYKATNDELREESEATATKNMGFYQEVLQLVNELRAEVGVAPLTLDMTMCKAATMRAVEMDYSEYYSHTRPDMSSCFTVLDYFGVESDFLGENIAAGQGAPVYVVTAWKNSPGHYENMTRPEFTKMGVGFSNTGVGIMNRYWCQLFVR